MTPPPTFVFSRRAWLQGVLGAGAATWLGGCLHRSSQSSRTRPWLRLPAQMSGVPAAELASGLQVPRGFTASRLDAPGAEPRWSWPDRPEPAAARAGRLRFCVAVDFREERRIEARLARSNRLLGTFDVRYAYAFQPFELALDAAQVEAVLAEGVRLQVSPGSLPLWIFNGGEPPEAAGFFAPHLLQVESAADPRTEFLAQFASRVSLQPFGWMEGCVLDGLQDLARSGLYPQAESALEVHLGQFLLPGGRLEYQDLRSRPVADRFSGIESTLPMAVIAARRPEHPAVDRVLAFWAEHTRDGGIICDGTTATAEGSYTIGYPLAVIAVQRQRVDLARAAVRQILARRDLLPVGRDLYLRAPLTGDGRTFRNWARAYAWYQLGLTRVWCTLRASPWPDLPGLDEVQAEAARIAGEAVRLRQPNGLWTCFLDRPDTGIDTSGSAGIAAAFALGAREGLLDGRYLKLAREADRLLDGYLTPDGLLTGVAQHNAGGEALQAGGYRVISQMGMGLLAQVHAHVCRV